MTEVGDNNTAKHHLPPLEGQIDLGDLFSVIWKGRKILIMMTVASSLLAIIYSLSIPNMYRAEALLAPASDEQKSSLAGLAGQFGGLASLAGVNLGGSTGKSGQTLAILNSRAFTEYFINKHDLLVPLFAMEPKGFGSHTLSVNDEIYDEATRAWVEKKPSAWKAYQVFSEYRSISEDKKTGHITISIDWYDAAQAKQWVDWLVEDINETIKSKEVLDAEKSIAYLKESLGRTSVVGFKDVFYSLIESQTKTVMLAEIRDEYALKTLDSAVVPEQKVKPRRAAICFLGFIFGGLSGLIMIFTLNIVAKQKIAVS